MEGNDFAWAADRMEHRRTAYERFSPVFWKPAEGVREMHAGFMRSQVEAGSAVALRSDSGFVLAAIRDDHYDIDDFAVEADDTWETDGRLLLESVPEFGPLERPARLRVVTARRDAAKRAMLEALGLTVVSRWWVKSLRPVEPADTGVTEVALTATTAMFVPAPPVYAPGGPVCILGDLDSDLAVRAAVDAEGMGAVLAVVIRDTSPNAAPPDDPVLTAAGFDNVSEFFEGRLGSST